jgi:2-polyprenyl-6-methoxyphenol hydroxylase-like FAD-dependent oxidoreductase
MVDVLVVGAGPIGLFLAFLLRRQGLDVTVIDSREGPVFDPRAAIIWPRTAEVLAAHGLGEAFRAECRPLQGVELQVNGIRRAALQLGGLDGPEPLAWIIEQHRTESVLRAALDVPVQETHTLRSLKQDAQGVTAQVSTPTGEVELRARYLVGCDGAHSTVRKHLGIHFEGRVHDALECLQVNAECRWRESPQPGFCRFDLVVGATLLSMPLPGRGHRFVSFRKVGAAPLTQPTVDEATAQLSAIAGEPLELTLTDPQWLTRARFQDRVAERLRVGRVVLCGDAAHVWAPIGGRGMNVGLLAANGLAWRLAGVARGELPEVALDAYSLETRAMVKRIMGGLRFNRTEYPSGRFALTAIDLALRTATTQRVVPFPVERLLSLYDVAPRGRLTLWPGRVPRVGERLPDAVLGDGRRVHGVVAAGRWTLLGVGCSPSPWAGVVLREVPLHDAKGRAWLGRRPSVVLVRPDGIVAEFVSGDVSRAISVTGSERVAE